jgi:hypothetical protein
MKTFSRYVILILVCVLSIYFSSSVLADDTQLSASGGGKEIFSGSIPSGDGIVSIKAISGKLYQVPAMSPLGVIQALAGTDSIETYKIGDELIVKKGILTLDAINSIENAGEKSWFVVVNDKQLEDYLLPAQEGLNTYPLKSGDTIIFAYGNPTRPASEGESILRVTIGAQAVVQATPVPSQTPEPVQTMASPEPDSKEQETPESNLNQPVYEGAAEPTPTQSPAPTSETNDPNQPVFEGAAEPTPTQSPAPTSKTNDPNQPVYEGSAGPETTQSPASTSETNDPNQPVYEGSAEPETTQSPVSTSETNDPNQPVYEGSAEPETTPSPTPTSDDKSEIAEPASQPTEEPDEPEDTETDGNTSSTVTHTASSTSRPSGQEVLYDGTISLPSGNVNVTADSGMEYDVGANTPIGLLQILSTDGKVPSVMIDDQGMRKGNILTIGSIAGYQWGEEAWFVQINGATLQDYITSADGLNIKTFGSGDTITYYYGKLDQSPESAKAAIYMKIE